MTHPKIFELDSFAGSKTRASVACDLTVASTVQDEIDKLFSKVPEWTMAIDGSEEPLMLAWQTLKPISVKDIQK